MFVLFALVASATAAPVTDAPAESAPSTTPVAVAATTLLPKADPAPVVEAAPAPVVEAVPAPLLKAALAPVVEAARIPVPVILPKAIVAPVPVVPAEIAPRSAAQTESKEPIAILSQESEVNPDGTYVNKYETANGISVSEESNLVTLKKGDTVYVVKGVISYTAPDGTVIETTYTADEDGFHPSGAHLPVAPEVPAYIAKSLEWSAAHPEEEEQEEKAVEKKP